MRGMTQRLRKLILGPRRHWGAFVSLIQRMREEVTRLVDWAAGPLLLAGFLLFSWLAYDAYSGLGKLAGSEMDRALEWLKFYAYLVGGIVLIWQVRISNRRATALEKTAALGEKGNITERFKSAIEHLGGASESVRMGGIYALYHVARESGEYAETVCKILCAHAKAVTTSPGYAGEEKPTTEIAAILDVLFPVIASGEEMFGKPDISNWHLQGANVYSRIMMKIQGVQVNLSGAIMVGANLSGANMREANLSKVSMDEANLSGANMHEANLSEAHTSRANLSGAYISLANLSGAFMCEADLTKARMQLADMRGANLSGANLSAANMIEANLSQALMSGAQVTAEQLLEAKTLYGAQLDAHIREEILRRKPELLAPPAEEK